MNALIAAHPGIFAPLIANFFAGLLLVFVYSVAEIYGAPTKRQARTILLIVAIGAAPVLLYGIVIALRDLLRAAFPREEKPEVPKARVVER